MARTGTSSASPHGLRAAPTGEREGEAANPSSLSLDEAFGDLYRRHFAGVVAFYGRRGVDPDTSRDLAQDVMLRAYRGFSEFEAREIERAQTVWLRRIALRVWANWVRARRGTQKRAGEERSLEKAREAGFEVGTEQSLWERPRSNPERQVIEAQARRRILSVLGDLPTRQRECLELWLDGAAYREIAERSGTSLQTVRSSLHKAKSKVRAKLGDSAEISDEGVGDTP